MESLNSIIQDVVVYDGAEFFQGSKAPTPTTAPVVPGQPIPGEKTMMEKTINIAAISAIHHNFTKQYLRKFLLEQAKLDPKTNMLISDFGSYLGLMYIGDKFYYKVPVFDLKRNVIDAAVLIGANEIMLRRQKPKTA